MKLEKKLQMQALRRQSAFASPSGPSKSCVQPFKYDVSLVFTCIFGSILGQLRRFYLLRNRWWELVKQRHHHEPRLRFLALFLGEIFVVCQVALWWHCLAVLLGICQPTKHSCHSYDSTDNGEDGSSFGRRSMEW